MFITESGEKSGTSRAPKQGEPDSSYEQKDSEGNTWDRTVINCSGWGIKQTTKIKLKNAGAKDNTFWYNLHSPGIISYCVKVTDENGDIVTNNGRHWFEVGSNTDGGDMKLLGYGVQIPSGRTYDVTVTVLCGVNITGYHHTIGLGNNPLLS